ncbi:MAG: hypothetical protein WC337_02805 [Candidatus Muiribacteriota bacterium]
MEQKNEKIRKEIRFEASHDEIHTFLLQVMDFKETYLNWFAKGDSPGNYPSELVFYVKLFDRLETHFADLFLNFIDFKFSPSEDSIDDDLLERLMESEKTHRENKRMIVELIEKNSELSRTVDELKKGQKT